MIQRWEGDVRYPRRHKLLSLGWKTGNNPAVTSICLFWYKLKHLSCVWSVRLFCVAGTRLEMWGCGIRCTGTRRPRTWRLTACQLTLSPDLMLVTSRSTAQWLLLLMKMVSAVAVLFNAAWSCVRLWALFGHIDKYLSTQLSLLPQLSRCYISHCVG